jgi:hypothetical protein
MADAELNALAAATLPIDPTDLLYVEQGGIGKKVTRLDFSDAEVKALTSTQSMNSTTGTAITGFTTSLSPGTYEIKCSLIWQAAATTTGAAFYVNCSGGTVTKNVGHVYTTTTGTTATTGVADQATVAATFQMLESRAWRANNTNPGAFGGVDTANADQLAILEGVVVVTATTSLQIMFASEVASSAVVMQVGSSLKINKIA